MFLGVYIWCETKISWIVLFQWELVEVWKFVWICKESSNLGLWHLAASMRPSAYVRDVLFVLSVCTRIRLFCSTCWRVSLGIQQF